MVTANSRWVVEAVTSAVELRQAWVGDSLRYPWSASGSGCWTGLKLAEKNKFGANGKELKISWT